MLPLPAPIPIWIGGITEPALARAVRIGDGWHGTRSTPEEAAAMVKRLRAERPDPGFVISLRSSWDGEDANALRTTLAGYAEAGIDHIVMEPYERALEGWLATVEKIARAGEGL